VIEKRNIEQRYIGKYQGCGEVSGADFETAFLATLKNYILTVTNGIKKV